MLKRETNKLGFQGHPACDDPLRVLRVVGMDNLDEATLLGMLLDAKSYIKQEGVMEHAYNKGAAAIRILSSRNMQTPEPVSSPSASSLQDPDTKCLDLSECPQHPT
ncbi:conjugal transfer protein TraD [Magnetovibrio blakemorei]|uniref:Uncharacterized protein n=1 Tax=Magnetovibrio blakemorei TaxID=28181 RepID=A0A1E5Q2R3_9PROT|nr:conjugal transfer protein TraD [Magnetovibrio blakemorei]OEJ63646.1 hypothetical protein BEN30_01700 [Magnetovibrio blakemorei]